MCRRGEKKKKKKKSLLQRVGVLNCCSAQVSINNKKVDLSYSFTESRAIRTCVDSSPCERRPCLNGGHCLSSAEYEFQCLCQDGFEGASEAQDCFTSSSLSLRAALI